MFKLSDTSKYIIFLIFIAFTVLFYRGLKVNKSLVVKNDNLNSFISTATKESGNNLQSPAANAGQTGYSGNFFQEKFDRNYALEESPKIEKSADPYWSITSGGYLIFENGVGKTIQGVLQTDDKWRIYYFKDNPVDSDNGYRPQNIFRMVSKSNWLNLEQQSQFLITKYNLSASSNRNASNGLFFLNRYKDANNLYYAGIRVDGLATIKKKINGNYYTISQAKIFDGIYDIDKNPILLPQNKWIGLKSVAQNNPDGSVEIKLFIDRNGDNEWELALEGKDDGINYGGKPFYDSGHVGIRTDFMDVQFKNYSAKELKI